MRYHGNWCGPNWSDGTHVASRKGYAPAVDEFDETCRQHDFDLSDGYDHHESDRRFILANKGKGFKREVAAHLVGTRMTMQKLGILKHNPSRIKTNKKLTTKTTSSMVNGKQNNNAQPSSKTTPKMRATRAIHLRQTEQIVHRSAPVTIGTTIRTSKPAVKSVGNGVRVTGRDFGGIVYQFNQPGYSAAASVPCTPSVFLSGTLGNMARTYESYRIRELGATYYPGVPTSTAGQIIITSSKSIKEPFINSSSSSFLPRVMTQANSVIASIFEPVMLSIECSNKWLMCDHLVDNDLDDSIAEEIQVYTSGTVTQSAGFLVMNYAVEFKDPVYQPHAASLPVWTGPATQFAFGDGSAVNATTDTVKLINGTVGTNSDTGEIYRCVLQLGASTAPTGPSGLSTMWSVCNSAANTTTALAVTSDPLTVVEGLTFYLLNRNDNFIPYASLDAAVSGGINGSFNYRTATTTSGTYYLLICLMRLEGKELVTTS